LKRYRKKAIPKSSASLQRSGYETKGFSSGHGTAVPTNANEFDGVPSKEGLCVDLPVEDFVVEELKVVEKRLPCTRNEYSLTCDS
jgi:hypothetical protein